MPFWAERNVVPIASTDVYGKRRHTRVFTIWGYNPVDAGTCRIISQNPATVINETDGIPLPDIGSLWSDNPNFSPLRLDSYDVALGDNQIIAQANYSSDLSDLNLDISFVTVPVQIPYANRIPTGAVYGGSSDGTDRTIKVWQLSYFTIPVCMTRMSFNARMHNSLIGQVDMAVVEDANKVFNFSMIDGSAAGQPSLARDWKFEGAQIGEIGPDFVVVRYSFISDPGTYSVSWPSEIANGGVATENFAIPEPQDSVFGSDYIRPPFHKLVPFAPEPPAGGIATPTNPNPPRFLAVPEVVLDEVPDPNQPPHLPGIEVIPIVVRMPRG